MKFTNILVLDSQAKMGDCRHVEWTSLYKCIPKCATWGNPEDHGNTEN